MKQKVRVALAVLALVTLVLFIALNLERASVHLLVFGKIETRLAWVILGSAALGAVAFHFFQAYRRARPKN